MTKAYHEMNKNETEISNGTKNKNKCFFFKYCIY